MAQLLLGGIGEVARVVAGSGKLLKQPKRGQAE
jgi:hypothetical protein